MGYEKISQKLTFYKAFFSPQWKFLIHTVLQCLSSKTTAWNEFSSTMASAIICLATKKKFNFSKYIFESTVKNLDNMGKFLMYPRFVQVFLDKQVDGMASHKRIYIAPSHTKKIFRNMRRVGKGFSGRETPLFSNNGVVGPRCQETIGDTTARTRFESVSKLSNDPLLARVGMSRRVEPSGDEDILGEDTSKQGRRINNIDADEDITLVNDQIDVDAEMFDVNALTGDEVFAEQEVAAKDVNLTVDEVTLAQAIAALKSVKPKVKGVVIQEPSTTTTTTTISSQQPSHDKAEIDEEERIARDEEEKNDEANIAWDDIQAKVDADYQLAERLQAEEREQAEEKRNKPSTKTQQKKTMITYLKNMEGWKHKNLKSKDFNSIKELFDKAFKRVNMFVDYRTDLVEVKIAGEVTTVSTKLLLLEEVTTASGINAVERVNAASEEVSTAELVSTS
ncbi:hypothetical protein Tco_0736364 [Tanacetum coccineum]